MLLRLHIDLGFDLASIVREYHVYVPLECDFRREAEGMQVKKEGVVLLCRRAVFDCIIAYVCTCVPAAGALRVCGCGMVPATLLPYL